MTQRVASFSGANLTEDDQGWGNWAYWVAKQERLTCRGAIGPVEVWIEYGGTPPTETATRAILDGFTRAAVWADDDSKHVRTFEPTFTNAIEKDSLRITLTWEMAE